MPVLGTRSPHCEPACGRHSAPCRAPVALGCRLCRSGRCGPRCERARAWACTRTDELKGDQALWSQRWPLLWLPGKVKGDLLRCVCSGGSDSPRLTGSTLSNGTRNTASVSEPRSYREAVLAQMAPRGAPRQGPVADLGHLSAFDVHPSHWAAEAGDDCLGSTTGHSALATGWGPEFLGIWCQVSRRINILPWGSARIFPSLPKD